MIGGAGLDLAVSGSLPFDEEKMIVPRRAMTARGLRELRVVKR